MTKTKTDRRSSPVDQQPDPEVLAFRRQFDERSPLDELVRRLGARVVEADGARRAVAVLNALGGAGRHLAHEPLGALAREAAHGLLGELADATLRYATNGFPT